MMTIVAELEESIAQMLEIYKPFANPGKDWLRDGKALQDLVQKRDQARAQGKSVSDKFRQLWTMWESSQPDPKERARVFEARNRIVELGLEVSRQDTNIQTQLMRKVDELKTKAVESDHKSKAVKAYSTSRSR